MKLKRPRYPEVTGTATYFFVQAGHRETAIDHAIEVIRKDAAREMMKFGSDHVTTTLSPIGDWVIESLIQGAWIREYHEWEKATKSYFEGHHLRNGSTRPDWKGKLPSIGSASHVDRVRGQLTLFGATVADTILDVLDAQRRLINTAKHESEYFVTEQNYRVLVQAIANFWNELAPQEEFTV